MGNLKQENEEKKKYLKSYLIKKKASEELELEYREISLSEIMPAVPNTGMPSAHNQRDLSDYAVKLDYIYTKYIKAINDRNKTMADIFQTIESIEDEVQKYIMRLRYIRGMDFNDIAEDIGCSTRQIHRFHSEALKKIVI